MKAISLWQPWGSLIMTGAKTWETRSWATSYRGPLVICAAKGGLAKWQERDLIERRGFGECWRFQGALAPLIGKPLDLDLWPHLGKEWPGVKIEDIPRGVALGVVDLVDCKRTEDLKQWEIAKELLFGNFERGRFAWKLENVRPLKNPIPVKGERGFFQVENVELTR